MHHHHRSGVRSALAYRPHRLLQEGIAGVIVEEASVPDIA